MDARRARLIELEEVMTTLQFALGDATLVACGRAARGHLEDPPSALLRACTAASISQIAAALVEHGFPEPTFRTMDGKGRHSQVCATGEHLDYVITRCPQGAGGRKPRSLKDGSPLDISGVEQIRDLIAALSPDRP
jgi:hypothetical protein